MKRMFIMGALALIVLLALPGAAMAAEDSVVVSGNIGLDIEVTAGADFDLSAMSRTTAGTGSTTVKVTTSSDDWDIVASGSNGGFMYNDVDLVTLSNPIGISLTQGSYISLATGPTLIEGAAPCVNSETTVYFEQIVDAADVNGDYDITVTFIGTAV
ncbi:hypothetical protein AZH53_09635 [Methanomicrobiaceae archaeon CYW5]|uniref:hypothetical protein n=1 Tax=Methanovulcanius yangii TaxID=1789227 RepID=UPI0029C9FB51|nr:hypothetical protein [Methanovulcanius yangii]MBT8508665.1 hypothetical protein [Methanovulcanius yangii]